MDPFIYVIVSYALGCVLGFLAGVQAYANTDGKSLIEGLRDIRLHANTDAEREEV